MQSALARLSWLPMVVTVAVALGVQSCSDEPAPPPGLSPCTEQQPYCLQQYEGYLCGDLAEAASCSGGVWRCRTGWTYLQDCICKGPPPPQCQCTAGGWLCDDGADGGDGTDGSTD